MYAKFIKKTDDNYKKYMQPNKQGFVFLVSSATIKTPENLIETFSEHIMIASEKVRCAFITGAFDGRSFFGQTYPNAFSGRKTSSLFRSNH